MKAVFDLEYWQPSYSVMTFIMAAEHARIKRGHKFIEVHILPGTKDGFGPYKRWPNDRKECRSCLENIVLPAISMLPSVKSVVMETDRDNFKMDDVFTIGTKFIFAPYVDAYREGIRPLMENVPREQYKRLITITLRECGKVHWAERDSQVNEWFYAARSMMDVGYRVVVIRDTRMAGEWVEGIECSPKASRDLGTRAKLYREAGLNLFVNNGPAWFALALDVPALIFKPTCEIAGKSHGASSMAEYGIYQGQQIVGHPDHQRLVWEPDRCAIIIEQVKEFMK